MGILIISIILMAIFPNYPNINNRTSLYEVNLKSGNHITEKVGTRKSYKTL